MASLQSFLRSISVLAFLPSIALTSPNSAKQDKGRPKISVFTAADQAAAVNSTIVQCGNSVVVVDAQFINPMVEALAQTLEKHGITKESADIAIFISHPHPDHFMGLQLLSEKLPKAKILASQETANAIAAAAPGMLNYFRNERGMKAVLPEQFTAKIEPVSGNSIPCGSTQLNIHTVKQGDTQGISILSVEETKTIIAADFAFYNAHVWTKETDTEHRKAWLQEIERVKKELKPQFLVPGHGPAGDQPQESQPIPADKVFTYTKDYLKKFDEAVKKAKTSKACTSELPAAMIKLYPNSSLKMALDASAPVQCEPKKG